MSLRDRTGQRNLLSKNMPNHIHISSVLLPAFFQRWDFYKTRQLHGHDLVIGIWEKGYQEEEFSPFYPSPVGQQLWVDGDTSPSWRCAQHSYPGMPFSFESLEVMFSLTPWQKHRKQARVTQIKELILRYCIFSFLSLVHSLRSKHMKSGISCLLKNSR